MSKKKGRRVRQEQARLAKEQRLGPLFGGSDVVVGKPKSKSKKGKYVTPGFADGNIPTGCTSGSLAQQVAALRAAGYKNVTVSDDGKSLHWS